METRREKLRTLQISQQVSLRGNNMPDYDALND